MKKNIRIIISCAIALTLGVALSFAMLRPAALNKAEIRHTVGTFEDSSFDILLPDPTTAQIEEVKANKLVSDAFHVYISRTNIANGENRADDVLLYLTNNLESVELSPFNEKRVISKSKNSEGIWIDFTLSEKTGLKLGDSLSFSIGGKSFSKIVTAIYESNTMYREGNALVVLNQDLKVSLPQGKEFGALFIKSNTTQDAVKAEFNDFVPEGRLRLRTEFDSDAAYESYLDVFYSGNYFNEIRTKASFLSAAESIKPSDNSGTLSILAAVILAVALLGLQAVFLIVNQNRFLKDLRYGKSLAQERKSWFLMAVFGAITGAVATIIAVLAIPYSRFYVSNSYKVSSLLPTIIALPIFAIIAIILSNYILKKAFTGIDKDNNEELKKVKE